MRVHLRGAALCLGLLPVTCACDGGRLPTSPTSPPLIATSQPSPTLPPNVVPTSISVGQVVRASITPEDPVCDPAHWDARAPCKVYVLVPATNGSLTVTMTVTTDIPISAPDVIDLMVTPLPNGKFLYSGEGRVQQLRLDVVAGGSYEIRINSYPYLISPPGIVDFELRTEM